MARRVRGSRTNEGLRWDELGALADRFVAYEIDEYGFSNAVEEGWVCLHPNPESSFTYMFTPKGRKMYRRSLGELMFESPDFRRSSFGKAMSLGHIQPPSTKA